MEFKYLSEVVLPQAPVFNYEDLKAELEQKCKEYENLVYTISNSLEEKEREEFTRLKVIKRMKEKNASG